MSISTTRLAAVAVVLCAAATALHAADAPLATAAFKNGEQAETGTADLSEGPEGVVIRVNVEGLTPGWHGIHFHQTGDCSDEGFKKSGSHVQHGEKEPHGLLNPEGPDDGDLPNLYVAADGTGQAEMFSERVTLTGADDDRAHLLDADGSAIVIHANPDDHMSQPIGGAGDRVACAVIEKAE